MSCCERLQIGSSCACYGQDVKSDPGGTFKGDEEIAALAQRLLCITDVNERQHLLGQVLELAASLQTVTVISLDDSEQLTPEVRTLLQDVGSVAERVFLLPAATGAVRYFVGKKIHDNVFDGVELAVGQKQDAFTATPAVAKFGTLSRDKFDRNVLAPALGRLNVLPQCLEHKAGVYIAQKFSEDGLDYVRDNYLLGHLLDFATFRGILYGVAESVAALHARGLIHHDLKLENVVFRLGENRRIEEIRLIDLESIRFISEQRTALAVLSQIMDMSRALRGVDHDNETQIKGVCQEYAHSLRDLHARLSLNDEEGLHASEGELDAIEQSICSAHARSLLALIGVLENSAQYDDTVALIAEVNAAFLSVVAVLNSMLSIMATAGYASPELFRMVEVIKRLRAGERVDIDSTLDLRSQDVWSVGVMMLIIVFRSLHGEVHAEQTPKSRFALIRRALLKFIAHVTSDTDRSVQGLGQCLYGMLRTHPRDRWTMHQLLEALRALGPA